MLNLNFSIKKINKILLSINELIKRFFDTFQKFNINKKKNLKRLDNKFTIILGLSVILVVSYFLIPTFYSKEQVKSQLKKQIFNKYNLEVKIEDNLRYGIFPKPHFFAKKLIILNENTEMAVSNYTKIFISTKNFFSFNNIKIKDLFFEKTEFVTNSKNIKFFSKIFSSNKSENKINFKNSTLFYEDANEDIIFLLKIENLNFLYDDKNNSNKLNLEYEIFNTPFHLKVTDDLSNKKIFTKLKSKQIRLSIGNEYDYSKKNINGLLEFLILNKENLLNYDIRNNSIIFYTNERNLKGNIDLKPFYFFLDLKLKQIDFKKLILNNSILLNLVKSKIMNNQNLNANLNFQIEDVDKTNYLEDLSLNINFNEGNLIINDSKIDWYNTILINLDNAEILTEKNEIKVVGEINFNFKDLTKFYNYYQIKRNYRQNIKNINLDFILNLDQKKIYIDNIKIDNNSNDYINNFILNFNSQNKDIFNKLRFRNFVREFFVNYDG